MLLHVRTLSDVLAKLYKDPEETVCCAFATSADCKSAKEIVLQRRREHFQITMKELTILSTVQGILILMTFSQVARGKECYVCSGTFPERECELWPDRVRHGPIKQECGNRYCTSYIRYRPMQHLLIPLGPNKPKATAAPLLPENFEAVSISRDCVDRVDKQRDNRCFTDGDGLGATCFTSCTTALCNKGLRKPNMTELHRGKGGHAMAPIGPNEFEKWTPSTIPPTTPVTKRTTTLAVIKDMDKDNDSGKGMVDGRKPDMPKGTNGKKQRPRPGHPNRGENANIRGVPEDTMSSGNTQYACATFAVLCSAAFYAIV